MPTLPTSSSAGNSIQIGTSTGGLLSDDSDEAAFAALGGKWEDEEERRFFEDIQDLREVVPKSILGIEESTEAIKENNETDPDAKKNAEDEEVKRLREELEVLEASGGALHANGKADTHDEAAEDEDDEYAVFSRFRICDQLMFFCRDSIATPTPSTPKEGSRPSTPTIAPQGPSQLLTALLARLPDCTNRSLIDQAAVEFAFLNSKAARKRLVKVYSAYNMSVRTLMHDSVVSHPSAENENGSTASLFSARVYIEQVYARHRHRACRRRRSTHCVYALCSYFYSWTKNSDIYRERRTSWWSLPKCASRYTVPHQPFFCPVLTKCRISLSYPILPNSKLSRLISFFTCSKSASTTSMVQISTTSRYYWKVVGASY